MGDFNVFTCPKALDHPKLAGRRYATRIEFGEDCLVNDGHYLDGHGRITSATAPGSPAADSQLFTHGVGVARPRHRDRQRLLHRLGRPLRARVRDRRPQHRRHRLGGGRPDRRRGVARSRASPRGQSASIADDARLPADTGSARTTGERRASRPWRTPRSRRGPAATCGASCCGRPDRRGRALQLATFVLTARALGPGTFGLARRRSTVSPPSRPTLRASAPTPPWCATQSPSTPTRFADAWGHALLLMLLSYLPVALAATAAAAGSRRRPSALATVAMLAFGEVLVGRATAAAELAMVAHGRCVRAGLVRLAAAAARAVTAAWSSGSSGAGSPGPGRAPTLAQSIALSAALLLAVARLPGPRLGIDRQTARLRPAPDAEQPRALAQRKPRPDRPRGAARSGRARPLRRRQRACSCSAGS